MMLTALFRVLLPQLIVRWLPIVTALTVGLALALAVARASSLGSMGGLLGIVTFFISWLLAEVFGGAVTGRFVTMRMPDEISLHLRDRHGVALSARAVDGILSVGHVVLGVALIAIMFSLFGGCNC
jgi:hypothetical protein